MQAIPCKIIQKLTGLPVWSDVKNKNKEETTEARGALTKSTQKINNNKKCCDTRSSVCVSDQQNGSEVDMEYRDPSDHLSPTIDTLSLHVIWEVVATYHIEN